MTIDPLDPSSWPTACPDCGVDLWRPRQCMGHSDVKDDAGNKTGEHRHCGNIARVGQTKCRMHGGSAPQARAAAERRVAQDAARRAIATYGLPVEVDPHVALLQEVHRTAGHVAWLGVIVAELEAAALTWGLSKEAADADGTRTEHQAGVNVWVKLYQDERRHLVAVCKAAVDAGVSERLVRLEEAKGRLIADLLVRILDDDEWGLTDDQRTVGRQVAARHLRALPEAS